jgi:ribosomal-protein-alanine N-acetyltransferase
MIETERLTIRLAEVTDVPEVLRFYGANRDHLQPYSPSFGADFLDEAKWLEHVMSRKREYSLGESFRAFIFPHSSPERILGNVNLTQVVRGAFQSCVLGYNLDERAQGHGYMTEAVLATVALAFSHWGLHRVAASYMPRNERSAAVLKRCGFRLEGNAPAYLRINGVWEDHVLTAITNPSWSPS